MRALAVAMLAMLASGSTACAQSAAVLSIVTPKVAAGDLVTVHGQNFSPKLSDIKTTLCAKSKPPCTDPAGPVNRLSPATITVQVVGSTAVGDYLLSVKPSSDAETYPLPLTVIKRTPLLGYASVILLSVGIPLLLGVFVMWLTRGTAALPNGQKVNWLQKLMLDQASNTYSLGKFQFYVWIMAAIIAYLYLCVSQSAVQGIWTWPDVPARLPPLFAISVATGVVSTGVTGAIGGSGSGEFKASFGDMITSGGVVAPERVQFLVWTLLGAVSFLYYTFSVGPADIVMLPEVPATFLQLMGISSAGYAGGKLARGPGPQVKSVTAVPQAGSMTLTIIGTTLATKGARYSLAEITAPAAGSSPAEVDISASAVQPSSVVDAATSAAYATKLVLNVVDSGTLKITAAPAAQKFRFTIVNPDGEKAVWEFATG